MPRHTRRLKYTNRIPNESINVLEIKNPSIIIILTGEQRLWEIRGMNIRKRVCMRIPTSKAQIQTSNTRTVIVHNHNLIGRGERSKELKEIRKIMYLINYGMLPFITLLLYKSIPSHDETRTQRCLMNKWTMSDEELYNI